MKLKLDPFSGRPMMTEEPKIEQRYIGGGAGAAGTSVTVGTSLPASGNTGDMFFDSSSSILYVYAGGWVAISGGGGSSIPSTAIQFIDGTYIEFVDGTGYVEFIT